MAYRHNSVRTAREPRSLAARCSHAFSRRDWDRGEDYFRRGCVAIVQLDDCMLHVRVRGTAPAPYDVWLDWTDAEVLELAVECTCPRFTDVGICKHVAAAILAADLKDVGKGIADRGPLELLPADELPHDAEPGDSWDQDVFSDEDEPVFPRDRSRPDAKPPAWQASLRALRDSQVSDLTRRTTSSGKPWSKPREIWYLLDVALTLARGWPCVSLRQRVLRKDGSPGALKPINLTREESAGLSNPEDRLLVGMLAGNEHGPRNSYYSYHNFEKLSDFAVAPPLFDALLPRLCASQRFGWLPNGESSGHSVRPLIWDDGPSWKFKLDVSPSADRKHWRMYGFLERGDAVRELSEALAILASGLVIYPESIARFEAGNDFRWLASLRGTGPILVPVKQTQQLAEQLAQMPHLPSVELPSELQWQEAPAALVPCASISLPKRGWQREAECQVTFRYGEHLAPISGEPPAWFDRETRTLVRRDRAAEAEALSFLVQYGAHRPGYYPDSKQDLLLVPPARIPELIRKLISAGWQVESEGSQVRRAGAVTMNIASGVDWFDLEGACDFDGVSVSLPKLLAAVRGGTHFVALDDGTQGVLPEDWLARFAPLAELGQVQGDRLRYVPAQAALLDALLASQESQAITVDRAFSKLRERLRTFDGVRPGNEARSFVGELRPYQREGLGWLGFLDEFGFGGCLADDMGLGKTVQILAFLDARRARLARRRRKADAGDATPAPSLVVVPRSLVFNWLEESRRFAPKLRVLNYTGTDRGGSLQRLSNHDLVVTTYGTLRQDIVRLREFEFDYAILDEAQAIKNAASQAAKACRLLKTRRRLAMTGTPVENHLGELWSLFEFLNPGMLGRNQKLNALISASRQGAKIGIQTKPTAPSADLTILGRALRPFMLRRTKQQVLSELPPKTEQTLFCDLDRGERKAYEELRDYYRRTLLERIDKVGVNKSKIHVLEALLRLRQASCHLGLLDPKKAEGTSAKLEALLEKLTEVVEEGHKALVFSQFTSLLAIVRKQLENRGIVFEYLDGRTTKRQAKVERFQSDPDCPLFLISLKAGGQGLNLTAADYVFILDPWWNPAVEAQAVDRAHRIGQEQHVFAYRLIARDTIEEKILQLQDRKRDLAAAIVSADQSLLRSLTAEDLNVLLS